MNSPDRTADQLPAFTITPDSYLIAQEQAEIRQENVLAVIRQSVMERATIERFYAASGDEETGALLDATRTLAVSSFAGGEATVPIRATIDPWVMEQIGLLATGSGFGSRDEYVEAAIRLLDAPRGSVEVF